MKNELIYVYCLSNGYPSILPEGLKSIEYGGFYVIMKNVSDCEFSEDNLKRNLSDIQWLEFNAREHIGVINKIMEYTTVIPFKFGTIFQSEDNLKNFIASYSDSLIENFKYIDAKEEWAVKIYCDRKILSDQIDELSEEAAALEKQIMESSPGKAFLLKRKKTDLVELELDRICKHFGQKYYDELKNLSISTSLNNLLPKEFTGRLDTMILNATFLVSKNQVSNFRTIVCNLGNRNKNFGFSLEITGPWPPFSFISIKEKQ